jgi:hypothetical protein
MWAKATIYMEKGVAAPALETNQKWLERTREGGPCVLRQFLCRNKVELRLFKVLLF